MRLSRAGGSVPGPRGSSPFTGVDLQCPTSADPLLWPHSQASTYDAETALSRLAAMITGRQSAPQEASSAQIVLQFRLVRSRRAQDGRGLGYLRRRSLLRACVQCHCAAFECVPCTSGELSDRFPVSDGVQQGHHSINCVLTVFPVQGPAEITPVMNMLRNLPHVMAASWRSYIDDAPHTDD